MGCIDLTRENQDIYFPTAARATRSIYVYNAHKFYFMTIIWGESGSNGQPLWEISILDKRSKQNAKKKIFTKPML